MADAPNKGMQLSVTQETKIVGLLARGDTMANIKRLFVDEEGRDVDMKTIMRVKGKYRDQLDRLKEQTIKKQIADAQAIRDQANSSIKDQLDNNDLANRILTRAGKQYLNDEITVLQYQELVKRIKTAGLSELVNVSKEMHAQAGAVAGAGPPPEDLAAMREALQAGDEVRLTQIMFKKNNGGSGGQSNDNTA